MPAKTNILNVANEIALSPFLKEEEEEEAAASYEIESVHSYSPTFIVLALWRENLKFSQSKERERKIHAYIEEEM